MIPFDFKVYAIDFDGTLCFSKWPELGPPNKPLIEIMKEKQARGDKIILWTCRTGKEIDDAVEWCKEQGLIFDAVNTNIPEIIELYGEDGRKVSADYYIDDKNMDHHVTLLRGKWVLFDEACPALHIEDNSLMGTESNNEIY